MSKTAGDWTERMPLGAGCRVLARHPAGLLALEKPAGLTSHPNSPADKTPSLLAAAYSLEEECYRFDGGERLWLLNRIDSPTSGIVLAAANPEIAAHVKDLFREHSGAVQKTYFAIVKGGRLPLPSGVWCDKIRTRRQNGFVRAEIGAGGLPSSTRFEWVGAAGAGAGASLSLLRLVPLTGRAHQLRVQCASRGRPILGDKTYGDFALNRRLKAERLFLHAAALVVAFSWRGKRERFSAESPLPPEFGRA
ncbi:MAG: RluA family pseudouridine synthase [Puniceicoccales bacterium]|jgi:23S rRNA-/tRNA-specific pseudouridylate synthase|nr:RluA family pseudouridine synthase [Puniceicoccales bacterium]